LTKAGYLAVLVGAVVVLLQFVYVFVPTSGVILYNMMVRQMVYAALAVVVFACTGVDKRPVRKAFQSNMSVVACYIIFAGVFLLLLWAFGGGRNVMAARSLSLGFRFFWEIGMLVVCGEIVRYKLIKNSSNAERGLVVTILTITLAIGHMNAIRPLIMGGHVTMSDFVFSTVLFALVVSAVASFFALEGSLFSVLALSLLYKLVLRFVPILPDITPIAFSLVFCAVLVLTAVVYNLYMNDVPTAQRMRIKRMDKYERKLVTPFNVLTAGALVLLAMFFMGVFPVYPLVVLTDSMSGTLERGSIVFVRSMPQNRVYDMVGEGYIIHFRRGIEYVHRTVEFVHGEDGRREFITQGDANPNPDPFTVTQDDVLGVARTHIPFVGWPYVFLRAVILSFR
jgi:signal peptidase